MDLSGFNYVYVPKAELDALLSMVRSVGAKSVWGGTVTQPWNPAVTVLAEIGANCPTIAGVIGETNTILVAMPVEPVEPPVPVEPPFTFAQLTNFKNKPGGSASLGCSSSIVVSAANSSVYMNMYQFASSVEWYIQTVRASLPLEVGLVPNPKITISARYYNEYDNSWQDVELCSYETTFTYFVNEDSTTTGISTRSDNTPIAFPTYQPDLPSIDELISPILITATIDLDTIYLAEAVITCPLVVPAIPDRRNQTTAVL